MDQKTWISKDKKKKYASIFLRKAVKWAARYNWLMYVDISTVSSFISTDKVNNLTENNAEDSEALFGLQFQISVQNFG